MAERKTKCVAVRSGRNTKFIGAVQNAHLTKRLKELVNRPGSTALEPNQLDQNATILHLDAVPLLHIFKYLCSNDVATMWTIHRNFQPAAVDAFKYFWKRGMETSITIYMCSRPAPVRDWENNYGMMENLGNFTSRVHLIGYQKEVLNDVDARLLMDILRLCPKIKTATLQHINYESSLQFLKGFGTTTFSSVDFLFSGMPQEALRLTSLTEFIGNVSASWDCNLCTSFNGNISHKQFENFFALNVQLKDVTLYAVNSDICIKDCNISRNNFFYMVRRVVLEKNMNINSFTIYAANKRTHIYNNVNLFETIVE